MSGPKKVYKEVLNIPITAEMKVLLKQISGNIGMAEYVRTLIATELYRTETIKIISTTRIN